MNYSIFKLINSFAGKWPALDNVMIFLSKSAILIVIALLAYLWIQKGNERKYTAFYIVLTLILALGGNFIIHQFYYHARPFVNHHVTKLITHSSDSSFISDHGTLVFSTALILLFRKDRLGLISLVWAILVGISRIFVGVHYPFDIIGAFILAGIVAIVVLKTSSLTEPLMKILLKIYERIINKLPINTKKNLSS
ncbi:undecaprenyl-diphosphatase [Gottfriedia acidiceleris]|uniref:undecaprenyl-diphosphatase n=1 Tax=Bacillaceae TaxID=186817 RepID=UPI000BED32E7|nr:MULTISPECIES: undecaprenyl-diphosphatase [unclassified Bacillus (in: firmicutes)]PEC48686.1 undecaprenyl-diphosphatase [Bacillus sp. AFS096315]PFM82681.1 undecaprenyl-diphosphatase [Bacillus sp. AFS077874]